MLRKPYATFNFPFVNYDFLSTKYIILYLHMSVYRIMSRVLSANISYQKNIQTKNIFNYYCKVIQLLLTYKKLHCKRKTISVQWLVRSLGTDRQILLFLYKVYKLDINKAFDQQSLYRKTKAIYFSLNVQIFQKISICCCINFLVRVINYV